MTVTPQSGSGCGAAVIGFVLFAILGWVVGAIIPVYHESQIVNGFESSRAYVLGVQAASGSGPRGTRQIVIGEAHQRKNIVVIGLFALVGSLGGWAVGKSVSKP